jgi:hypothetical protein
MLMAGPLGGAAARRFGAPPSYDRKIRDSVSKNEEGQFFQVMAVSRGVELFTLGQLRSRQAPVSHCDQLERDTLDLSHGQILNAGAASNDNALAINNSLSTLNLSCKTTVWGCNPVLFDWLSARSG